MSSWHRIHGRSFFHQHFDGLLASIVLMRSHLLTFGGSLICHFSLAVFEIFLFVIFNTFDYDTSRCDCILLGVKFLGCVFLKLGKFQSLFLHIFSYPFFWGYAHFSLSVLQIEWSLLACLHAKDYQSLTTHTHRLISTFIKKNALQNFPLF